ncbi:MAG: SEC-C domain-containing protein [Desulfobacterales bacterium]|nr:SEC-C domain-containing protein [Desulfobacterales bacterium]
MNKIGRNELCPCGSGKKFKNCHLGKEDEMIQDGISDFSEDMSARITSLKTVTYGRTQEIVTALDIKELTGTSIGIKFVDLNEYDELDLFGRRPTQGGKDSKGGVVINVLKTQKTDQGNIYVAISPGIEDNVLVHELAHVLDHLGGSKLMPGIAMPLSFELGVPVEHLEHLHEFCYWLTYLQEKFNIQPDADDTIISYLYKNDMLIKGEDVLKQDTFILKTKSERILKFLSDNSAEIDALICELPGYIGSQVKKD